jgi:hypothetical protein
MQSTTLEIIKTTLKGDTTLTPEDRKKLLVLLHNGGKIPQGNEKTKSEPRILRRAEAAKRLGVTLRAIDKWACEGILRRIKLPGRTRACGFSERDINELISDHVDGGRENEQHQ